MPRDINAIKIELAKLASQKDKRIIGRWQEGEPSKWKPETVIDPRSGKYFTPAGAWDFIVEELGKKKTSVQEKLLEKPLAKVGYQFVVESEYGRIYIKVRLGKGKIIGRSFHA